MVDFSDILVSYLRGVGVGVALICVVSSYFSIFRKVTAVLNENSVCLSDQLRTGRWKDSKRSRDKKLFSSKTCRPPLGPTQPWASFFLSEVKRRGHEANHSLSVSNLRMNGAVSHPLCMLSWRVQGFFFTVPYFINHLCNFCTTITRLQNSVCEQIAWPSPAVYIQQKQDQRCRTVMWLM